MQRQYKDTVLARGRDGARKEVQLQLVKGMAFTVSFVTYPGFEACFCKQHPRGKLGAKHISNQIV